MKFRSHFFYRLGHDDLLNWTGPEDVPAIASIESIHSFNGKANKFFLY